MYLFFLVFPFNIPVLFCERRDWILIRPRYLTLDLIMLLGQHCSGNGLAPNRRQAINWTNADPVHWRIYAALGRDELKYVNHVRSVTTDAMISSLWQWHNLPHFSWCLIGDLVVIGNLLSVPWMMWQNGWIFTALNLFNPANTLKSLWPSDTIWQHKNIGRHTVHTIVLWSNPKQGQRPDVMIMRIRLSEQFLANLKREMVNTAIYVTKVERIDYIDP